MTLTSVTCPDCDGSLEVSISSEWLEFSETPAFCKTCDRVVWIRITEDHGGILLDKDQIPPFNLGFKVKVVDEHSILYGKEGYVIDKDHVHYRVKSGHILVWVPEHWVERA